MIRRCALRVAAALTGAIATITVVPTAAFAAPTNDDYASAWPISSLPFTKTVDTSEATWDPSDPTGCGSNGSVWFSFTPSTNVAVVAHTFGSNYDTVLSAWTGNQGSLSLVECNDDFDGLESQITFTATAGTTYYFMAASCCGDGGGGGGNLQFSVTQSSAPINDNFADAMAINALPFADQPALGYATRETGEPTSCLGSTRDTVWYSFTPTTTQSISASVNQYGSGVAAYRGSSLSNLIQVGCQSSYYSPLTFRAEAGTTYYFQVIEASWGYPVTFRLAVAANPVASFSYYPGDPNSFDDIEFSDYSSDPANAGIASRVWDFGDGTTSTAQYARHRYAADGDYTVQLTVTTQDGRTGSTSQLLRVRTHDVSMTRLAVPATARIGQTVSISVYLENTRYDETVRVDLEKSVPGGYSQVGSLTQLVQVKTGGQTTRFLFSYTVTEDDLSIGKVTFRAEASIIGYRDALPADNELLSTPVNIV